MTGRCSYDSYEDAIRYMCAHYADPLGVTVTLLQWQRGLHALSFFSQEDPNAPYTAIMMHALLCKWATSIPLIPAPSQTLQHKKPFWVASWSYMSVVIRLPNRYARRNTSPISLNEP